MHGLLAESFSFLLYKMKHIDYNLFPLPFIFSFLFFFTQNLEENIQKAFFLFSFFFPLVSVTNIFVLKVTLNEGKRISHAVVLPKACFPLWKSSNKFKILDRDLTEFCSSMNQSNVAAGLSGDFVKHVHSFQWGGPKALSQEMLCYQQTRAAAQLQECIELLVKPLGVISFS